MKVLRWLVGRLVLLVNFLTLPRAGKREPAYQAEVEKAVSGYALYEFPGCPFCVRVRRAIRRLNLPIERRNASKEGEYRQQLLQLGGKIKAPCLRIDHEDGSSSWMYESKDIVEYLEFKFPLQSDNRPTGEQQATAGA